MKYVAYEREKPTLQLTFHLTLPWQHAPADMQAVLRNFPSSPTYGS